MLRAVVLRGLRTIGRDITIRHHLTRRRLLLHAYKHKGYWFHGRRREADTVKIFDSRIHPGDFVLEVGGHIGYFTTFFATKVGTGGRVDVFEPSEENLRYLRRNVDALPSELAAVVHVEASGAGDTEGEQPFFLDPLTGQNNSFVRDFAGFYRNREVSGDPSATLREVQVPVTTLDAYVARIGRVPEFVKIDVEGFEWNVIQGFAETLRSHRPDLLLEVQADAGLILDFLVGCGYSAYNDRLEIVHGASGYQTCGTPNLFFSERTAGT